MGFGLVLEGGGMRGMYTAGVLDVLLDAGIRAECAVGVSAGALFGVNYVSGQKGRAVRYNKRFNGDRNYMGLLPLLREGNFISTEYAYEWVPHELDPFDDEAYQAAGIPFYAVVTDVETGKPAYLPIRSVFEQMDTLRASGSLPFVSRAVEIQGKKYLDGGISDSIPFLWMGTQGPEKQVVVLTRDASYRKSPATRAVSLYRLKYPKIADQLRTRHLRYNHSLAELRRWERDGKAFVFRPSSPIRLSTLERSPERIQEVYDLGVRDAKAQLDALWAYLGE